MLVNACLLAAAPLGPPEVLVKGVLLVAGLVVGGGVLMSCAFTL